MLDARNINPLRNQIGLRFPRSSASITLKATRALVVFCLAALLLVQPSSAEEPSKKELSDALSFEIPGEWRVDDLTVEISQNNGSAVEPLIKSRFRADVKLFDDTYIPVANVQGVAILSPQLRKNEIKTIYGISTATLYMGSWKISFELQGQPFANAGKPRGAYPGRTLIGGSEEHRAFVKELEAERARIVEEQNAERLARIASERAYMERAEAHFASVESLFTSGIPLAGKWSEPGYSRRQITPFQLSFLTFDPSKGAFKGQMVWESGAILAIEGVFSDRKIRFSETGWVENPKAKGNNFNGGEGEILSDRIVGVMCVNTNFAEACRRGNAEWVLTLPREPQ